MDKNLQDSLSNFASALENLVEELKTQSSVEEESKNSYQAILGKGGLKTRMKRIEAGIKKIKDDTTEIIKNQKELLKMGKAQKQGEETGLFDKTGDKKSMDKIKDGVGTIVLIAGAVLAIGMAFKIISPVDVVSVLALSFAITMLGLTLAKLSENGMPSVDESLMIGLALLSFTTGVVASSYLLQFMPEVTIPQLLTFGAILGMFALMSFGMENLMDGMKGMKPQHVLYLPLILAGISLAILLSSFILNEVKEVKYEKLLNILAMGVVLGLLAIVMSIPMYMIGKMGGSILIGAALSVLIFPLMSLAVMLSSYLISMGDYSKPLPIDWAYSFGMSMLILSLPVAILGLVGPLAFVGALALIAVSAAIAISSQILAYVNVDALNKVSDGIAYFVDTVGGAIVRFATDFLPILIKVAKGFVDAILPPLTKFLVEILPPLGKFLKTILQELFPYVQEIFDYIKTIIMQVDDVLMAIAKIIDSVADIFPKIGTMFERIGEGMAKPLRAIESIIRSVGDTIERVINSVVNGIMMLSELDPEKLKGVGAGLDVIGAAISSMTGGWGDLIKNMVGGGDQDPLTRILSSISKYGGDVVPVGKSIYQLAKGIEKLNDIEIDDEQVKNVLAILDKINTTGASANIETVNKQVLDGTKLVEQIKGLSVPQNEEMVAEMKTMNRQLSQIVSHSSNISSQLNNLRVDDDEPSLEF